MQDNTPVIRDNMQVKEVNMNRVYIAESGKPVELDECESSISSLDTDKKEKAMVQPQPGEGKKEPVSFAPNPMNGVPGKTVLAFSS